MDTVDFLRHVLAVGDGWICIDIKNKGKGFRHKFFRSPEEAATFALDQDAKGETVYFACAVFKDITSRKQVNVAYLKSLWGDCDVGPDKPYKTRDAAVDALDAFLQVTKLPPPTVVLSGPYGMHFYWVLDAPLTPEQWRPQAEALRELCKLHGFMLDHSRTADHASVLRPPGTHNRKHGSELVTVAHVGTPSRLADLPLLAKTNAHPPAPLNLLNHASVYSNRPSDAHKVAASCAQLGHVRDVKGDVSYDLWLWAIWTLHFTVQGDAIAHDWSSGHLNYTYEETQRKLDEATGPIKCATFDRLNDKCKTCPFWGKISTPLELGRDAVGRQQELQAPQSAVLKTAATDLYSCDERGLFLVSEKTNRKGEVVPVRLLVSRWPITLSSVCRGERDGDFSLLLTMTTPHMGELPITISSGIFFSSQGTPELHRKGAVIHDQDLFRDYVRRQMDNYHEANAPQAQYSQFGWKDHDNAFLVGSKLFTPSQIITIIGTPEVERRARLMGPRSGSLQAWSNAANKLFAAGCEPHSFALCCSFGALLMHFLSAEEGGAIVNLVSTASATGKTTGLEAVASVWGELNGLRLLDEDTQVSRGVFLGTLGNLPCVFDELHKRDPDSIRQFVTMFTSGRDKLRAKPDGTLRETAGEWQTILIIGSNISLTDIITTKNQEEAQAFRIIEFITAPTFQGNDGDQLRRQLMENRGWAGEAFIRYLMTPGMLAAVRADLDKCVEVLWDPFFGFDKRHRFWIRGIACMFAAARIVTQMGILDFDPDRIFKYAIKHCQERKDSEGKRDNVQVLNEALYDIWASTIHVDVEWRPRGACLILASPSPNKQFLARRVRESGRMYVLRSWLRKWLVDHNIDRTSFLRELKMRGVILNDQKFVTLGAGTDLNTGGQIVCIEIDMHHPLMTEGLQGAEAALPAGVSQRFPGAISPSPPSTLQ